MAELHKDPARGRLELQIEHFIGYVSYRLYKSDLTLDMNIIDDKLLELVNGIILNGLVLATK